MLFDLADLGDLDKPLTPKILSDPSHKITKHILYIYSMESFIYADLNQACRKKEKKKIQFYGAYAAALSYIIYSANRNRKTGQLKGKTVLYRGLKIQNEDVEKYVPGNSIRLTGYTSTTREV